MTPFYNTLERIDALETAAKKWLNTPWRLNWAIPGPQGGVSCSRQAFHEYVDSGFLTPVELPRDNLRALTLGLVKNLRDFFPPEVSRRFLVIENPTKGDLQPGDLILLRQDGSTLHLGVMLQGGRFSHVLRGTGSIISSIYDPTYDKPLVEVLRPVA